MLTLGLEGKKWDIFKSTVDLFAANGYDNTSMRDIADANKIKTTSLYGYFSSKESLLALMYQFYVENVRNTVPDLDNILPLIPSLPPKEILFKTTSYFEEDLQSLMDKIFFIYILRSNLESEAYNLIWQYNYDISQIYLRAILQKMIDLDVIEALDIDTFLELYISFCFTAMFKQNTSESFNIEKWVKGLDMLFSIPKEKLTSL